MRYVKCLTKFNKIHHFISLKGVLKMIYSQEVEEHVPGSYRAQNMSAAPIPEEGKWVHAKRN